MIQIPAAGGPGSTRSVSALSPMFMLPSGAVQRRIALAAADVEHARRYVVLEGESARTLVQSASQQAIGQEAVLEGRRTGRSPMDLVVYELQTYQWSGTQRSLPVELQWTGYDERPSTFFYIDPTRSSRAELTAKIAQWVRVQLAELRKVRPKTIPSGVDAYCDLRGVNEQSVHLVGLYGVEDDRREVVKYVTDLSLDGQSHGI